MGGDLGGGARRGPRPLKENFERFLARVQNVSWLEHAGKPSRDFVVIADAVQAFDQWNDEMFDTWTPRTTSLEKRAAELVGDAAIDEVFSLVSAVIDDRVRAALESYFAGSNTDQDLVTEVLDAITRDMSWAAVEALLGEPGFFTLLLEQVYAKGRWPCAWEGAYPSGRAVVL